MDLSRSPPKSNKPLDGAKWKYGSIPKNVKTGWAGTNRYNIPHDIQQQQYAKRRARDAADLKAMERRLQERSALKDQERIKEQVYQLIMQRDKLNQQRMTDQGIQVVDDSSMIDI